MLDIANVKNATKRNEVNGIRRKSYKLQRAYLKDIPKLLELEKQCWSRALRLTKSQIQTRIKKFPEGQFVIKVNKQLVAVLYTQCIRSEKELKSSAFDQLHLLSDPKGEILQLLSMPKGSFFPRPGKISVTFGEPLAINMEEVKGTQIIDIRCYQDFTHKLRSAILSLENK